MKKLYIIPGFGEKNKYAPYQEIKKSAQKKGYKAIPIDINWSGKLMTDFVIEARKKIEKNSKDNESLYILGFSFGAFIALELAKEIKFKKLFVCSLSPFYADDLKYLPNNFKKGIWAKRIEDFKNYSFPENIKTDVTFMFGEKEYKKEEKKIADKMLKARYKMLKGKKSLILVKGAEHDIRNKGYIEAINKVL